MTVNSKIKEKLKLLPALPGVYIMKDVKNTIIYVGKAKILKNRVRQYFRSSTNHSPKVAAMVANVWDFDYIITDSEFEALCLECNLIKSNSPKYNILLKDDKHYPFIRVSIQNEYPALSMVRKTKQDGAKYYGPYPSAGVVYDTIDLIKDVFNLQHCKKVFPGDAGRERPCLYYSMHKCDAPCAGNISSAKYRKKFEDIIRFLDGNHGDLIKSIRQEMTEAAALTEYERAADRRNLMLSLEKITRQQKVISATWGDIDVFAASVEDDIVVIEVFYVRSGKLIGNESFKQNSVINESVSSALEGFITAFYNRDALIPDMVLTGGKLSDAQSVAKWLSDKKGVNVTVRTPVRGELKKLADMAQLNAKQALLEYKIELLKKNSNEKALAELADSLGLAGLPHRIEAYDISNTGGSENVGSMVVFENGKKKPPDYKRYKIKYVVGSNDYECLKEVLARRFLRYHSKDENTGFAKLPSLILVDGGKGHVSAALEALYALDITVPVFGMFKNSHHKTAGLTSVSGEVSLPMGSAAFRLVTHIQDEAHRFAINYHRNLRNKAGFLGELENIRGVGPARRKSLMKHFKSISRIKEATLEELCLVSGIDNNTAVNIYEYFRSKG